MLTLASIAFTTLNLKDAYFYPAKLLEMPSFCDCIKTFSLQGLTELLAAKVFFTQGSSSSSSHQLYKPPFLLIWNSF